MQKHTYSKAELLNLLSFIFVSDTWCFMFFGDSCTSKFNLECFILQQIITRITTINLDICQLPLWLFHSFTASQLHVFISFFSQAVNIVIVEWIHESKQCVMFFFFMTPLCIGKFSQPKGPWDPRDPFEIRRYVSTIQGSQLFPFRILLTLLIKSDL